MQKINNIILFLNIILRKYKLLLIAKTNIQIKQKQYNN